MGVVAEALRVRESGAEVEAERLEEAEATAVAGFLWRGAADGTAGAQVFTGGRGVAVTLHRDGSGVHLLRRGIGSGRIHRDTGLPHHGSSIVNS